MRTSVKRMKTKMNVKIKTTKKKKDTIEIRGEIE